MPHKNKLTLLLLIVLALTIANSAANLRGQVQISANHGQKQTPSKDREGVDFESQFPIVDYDADPVESDGAKERKSKSKRYDGAGLVSQPSSPEVEEAVLDIRWQERVEALPVRQSAAIVLGTVQGTGAYLSNDKSGVYTEFTIRIDEVLKGDDSSHLSAGITISADRPGGFVKFPHGQKILYRMFGLNMPRVGRKYVLFLSNPEQSQNYNVLTGYELSPRGVNPLDVARHFDTYKGMDQAAFLKVVRDTVSSMATSSATGRRSTATLARITAGGPMTCSSCGDSSRCHKA